MSETETEPVSMARLPETAVENLLGESWEVFRVHRPVGAYLPVGQLDGDCRECGGAWPCGPVLDLFVPVTTTIRVLAALAPVVPAQPSAEEGS